MNRLHPPLRAWATLALATALLNGRAEPAAAQTAAPTASAPASMASSTGSPEMQALAGVYKHRFRNALASGEAYDSEDIIELVPHSATHLYVRIELAFYNGHSCSLSGMARQQGQRFVYTEPADRPGDAPCQLTLWREGGQLKLSDGEGSCSAHCGARGSLRRYEIPMSRQRPIRYLPRLLASPEYRSAAEALQVTPPRGR